MKSKREHWAYEELRKHLEEKTESWVPHLQDASDPEIRRVTRIPAHERGWIFLMNPALRQELDLDLFDRIYPHILEVMEGHSWVVPTMEEIQRTTQDGHEWVASRVVVFLMTDPARPVLSNNRPLWYFRFTLSVRPLSYMLTSECLISVPFAAAGSWLLDVLTDSRLQEAAPRVSVDQDEYVLSLSSGAGQSYKDDEWKDPVSTLFLAHVEIAKYVDQFEQQSNNRILRSRMIETITAVYGTRGHH
jgi:hypothetical protein